MLHQATLPQLRMQESLESDSVLRVTRNPRGAKEISAKLHLVSYTNRRKFLPSYDSTSCLLAELGRIAGRVSLSLSLSLSRTTYWYSSRRVRRVEKIARRAGPSKPRVSTKQITERQAGMRLGVCGRNVHFEEPRTSSRKTSLR